MLFNFYLLFSQFYLTFFVINQNLSFMFYFQATKNLDQTQKTHKRKQENLEHTDNTL